MTATRRSPVIIGVGQITDTKSEPTTGRSPLELMVDVAKKAGEDTAAVTSVFGEIDSIAVVRSFSDTVPAFRSPYGRLENAPWSVANRIGATPREYIYPPQGGDTPQTLAERAAGRISEGASDLALIVGAEALRTERNAKKAGLQLDWSEGAPEAPNELEGVSTLYSETEVNHGMRSAVAMYALFEQALRQRKASSLEARRIELGKLFENFAAVAATNPLATRREGFSAESISTLSPTNRYVGYPYTRLMTANAFVDQAAAYLICSEEKADQLGVPIPKRVYLHGSTHGHEEWFVTERNRFDQSPAIRHVVRSVLETAEISVKDLSFFDIYSCFASAIEIAADEIEIPIDDPRGLTVTGGLPFFGGPGNNYVTHAIAEIVMRLRAKPGSFGLVTANGGLLTKHAAGLYSTTPPKVAWQSVNETALQREIDKASGLKVELDPAPEGRATVETYTIVNGRNGPERGIIVGRLLDSGRRFVANTPEDAQTLAKLETIEGLGLTGRVNATGKINIFTPEF